MDKLKYVKIENEDGSLSDNIPLGVDAENVDVTSADNSQNLADYISVNDGKINSINSQIDDLQDSDTSLSNQIKSLSSGSPKGSYATVNALKSANPETGVYVIQEDGHLYSWTKNGNDAIDLGVYQATQIEDNSIDLKKIREPMYLTDNLSFTLGKTIQNGEVVDSEYAALSDFIRIRDDSTGELIYGNDLYFSKVAANWAYCAVYGKNQDWIRNLRLSSTTENYHFTFDNKDRAYFLRLIKYPDDNQDLIVANVPIKNLKWLKVNINNLSDDIINDIKDTDEGIDIVKLTNFIPNTFINTSGILISRDDVDASELIPIRNEDGTRIYDKLYFSKAHKNLAACATYGKDGEFWYGNLGPGNQEAENWSINLDNAPRAYYLRIFRFHDIPDLKVVNQPIKKLEWLKVEKDNLSDNIINNIKEYKERPENGEVHFSINIERVINNVEEQYIDNCILFLPENYNASGEKSRLVISCHGSGTVINDNFHINSKTWNKFLYDMGYAILDVNGGVDDGRHYGAPFAIQSYYRAYQYVINNYNLYPEVFVLGASMGGLSSFSLIEDTQIPVLAQADFCGVIDHYKSAWCKPWWNGNINDFSTQRKSIAQYFNFNNYDNFQNWTTSQIPSEEEKQYYLDNIDKIAGYNPIIRNSINNDNIYTNDINEDTEYAKMSKIHKVPLKIWHSKTDKTVSYKYSQYLYNAIKKTGGLVELKLYETGAHTPGWGEKESILNYDNKLIEGFNNEVECYKWFKKFE